MYQKPKDGSIESDQLKKEDPTTSLSKVGPTHDVILSVLTFRRTTRGTGHAMNHTNIL